MMNSANDLPVIPPDRADDLHHLHWADDCDLVLFMAGNQFMVMPELIDAFQSRYPDVRRIFYETLPPRLELRQILAEGAMFQGSPIKTYPDIYASVNQASMKTLEARGHIGRNDYHLYLHNRLTLMVPEENPAGIQTISDLGADRTRISQPDPAGEDIAFHIMNMYRNAGGEALVERIMKTKRAEGTTILTIVHHRETPLRIAKRTVDVGPVWATEALHARTTDLAFDIVEPGPDLDQRDRINYYICRTTHAPHTENAKRFLDFVQSKTAQAIYKSYGFVGIDGC
jgi:ABC-type molybdate transport system substrate-binding protein